MKRKQFLTTALALTMAGAMLTGCGDKTEPVESPAQTSEKQTTPRRIIGRAVFCYRIIRRTR